MSKNIVARHNTYNPMARPDGWYSIPLGDGAFLQAPLIKDGGQIDITKTIDKARIVKRTLNGAVSFKPVQYYDSENMTQMGRDLHKLCAHIEGHLLNDTKQDTLY